MTTVQIDTRSQKWIKQGRGTGAGKEYHPWLTVRDLASSGRSHRVWGFQTQRIHHLFSDLELSAFLLFDWNPVVIDIREKYPLRIDDTVEISRQAGIRHPSLRGKIRVMYTDFLLDTNTTDLPQIAIQVKTLSDLSNPRTVEKLEIERRYWGMKSVPWYLLTDKQVPKIVMNNINWLYPAQVALGKFEDILDAAQRYLSFFLQNPAEKIAQAGEIFDQTYCLAPGESLRIIRSLLAWRVFLFDIRKPWVELTVGELKASPDIHLLRDRNVANQ
jgi:hypothetical protein